MFVLLHIVVMVKAKLYRHAGYTAASEASACIYYVIYKLDV